jgi:hypothetical protein
LRKPLLLLLLLLLPPADKIFIDIGGIAELHIVMSMVGCYFRAFKQAVLIVKNKYFKHLLGSAQVRLCPQLVTC